MSKQDNPTKKPEPGANPAADANMEMGSMSKIRTLVAINQQKNLEAPLAHLERNYYELYIVNRIPDLIRGLQVHRPQIVLLSWNLKNTDVKKVYRLLTQKFHLICIVFTEDSGTRSTASLMSSGIPNSLLAPFSGPSIHMRIQSLLAPRLRPRKRAIAPSHFSKIKSVVDKAHVPPHLEWKPMDQKNGEKMWRGVSSTPEKDNGGVFFFKGPGAPVYDKFKKEWNVGNSSKGGVFMQERAPAGQEYSAIQEGPDGKVINMTTSAVSAEMLEATEGGTPAASPLDTNFDWEAALKEAENDISDALKEESTESSPTPIIMQERVKEKNAFNTTQKKEEDSELGDIISLTPDIQSRNPQGGESILAQALRTALTKCPGNPNASFDEKAPISKMTVCTVNSDRFCGYMVCVSYDNNYQRDFMNHLMPLLKEEMKNIGESLKGPLNILEIEIGAGPFGPWAENKADFTVTSPKSGLSLAFFSTPNQPQVIEASDESVLGISLEKDIAPDMPVLFNVYIHLQKNDKYLLYLNNGQAFTAPTIEKFLAFGVHTIYIRKTDKELFLTYCAQNFIKSSLK